MALLTDRTLAQSSAITTSTLIHIVDVNDFSQNPAGSSYKAELGQLIPIFSGTPDTYITGGTYSANTITFINSTGGTFDVTGITFTFTGGSGNCVTDFYVSNIHSCSPLFINPLDEGNVYFGSTSAVTIDLLNNRLGVGLNSPQHVFHVSGSSNQLYFSPTSTGGSLILSGNSEIPTIQVLTGPYLSNPNIAANFGIRAWDDVLYSNFGKVGDVFVRGGNEVNGVNIINAPSSGGREDYIRFYAGQTATGIADVHIQGSGATRGYVGIRNENPSANLDVGGVTKTTSLTIVAGANNGYVLTSTDTLGNASWQPLSLLSGSSVMSVTNVSVTFYTATTSYSYYGVTLDDEVNIEIPDATGIDGFTIRIKDERGNASIYPIIITPALGLIDGSSSVTMSINYMSLTMVARNNNWWII